MFSPPVNRKTHDYDFSQSCVTVSVHRGGIEEPAPMCVREESCESLFRSDYRTGKIQMSIVFYCKTTKLGSKAVKIRTFTVCKQINVRISEHSSDNLDFATRKSLNVLT